jgi:hypothetical protein
VTDNICGEITGKATATLLNVPVGAAVTYLWSNGQNGQTATALTSGVYAVTATITLDNTIYAGCMYVDTVNVNDTGGPVATLVATAGASCTSADGSAVLDIQPPLGQPASGPFTVSYTGPTTGSLPPVPNPGQVNVTGLKAGSYVFTVTDAITSCKSVVDVIVPTKTPNGFVLAVVPKNATTCGAQDGNLKITVTGGAAPFTYRINGYIEGVSTLRTFTRSGLPAGVYVVEVTDANGCVVRKENVLINDGGTPVAGWTKTDALCPDNTGMLQFAGSGLATDEYVVTISGTATEIGRTPGDVAVSYPVPGGTYLITKVTSTTCTSQTLITVNQPKGFDFNVQPTNPTCLSLGSLMVVQPSGGTVPPVYSYTIAGPTGIVSSSLATGLVAGSYTVTVGDSRGCHWSSLVVLTPASNLSVTASATPAIACVGQTISLSATTFPTSSTGLTFAWKGPDGYTNTGQTTTAIATTSGSYTVTVTDANGCTAISSTSVTIGATPTVAATPSTVCVGETVTLNTTPGGTSYQWQGPNFSTVTTVPTVSILNVQLIDAGVYSVTITGGNGCTGTGSTTVTVNAPPSVTALASSETVCVGGNLILTAMTSPTGSYTYTWSGPNGFVGTGAMVTINNVLPTHAGSYSVVVTGANGCSSSAVTTAPVTVTVCCSDISLNIVKTDAGCGKANGEATVTASPSGTYTYLWSNGLTGSHVTGLLAGSYTVTVSDASGCTSSTVVSISDVEGPKLAGIVSTSATCLAANGGASVTATGGTGNLSYLWSTGATGTSLSSVVAGLYSVTVTDSKGCIDIAEVTIDRSAGSLTLAVGSLPSACSLNTGMVSVTALSGTAPYRYLWSNGSTSTGQTGLTSGVYSVTVTDANGCWVENSVNVNDVSGPSVVASFTAVQCSGGSTGIASVSVSGGSGILSYLWSTGATTSSVSNLAAGTYTVTVTDINGCQGSDEVTISEPAAIQAELSPSLIACGSTTGDIVMVSISGGTAPYRYLWSNGMTSSSLTTVAAGSYTVVITDGVGCTATGSATLSLPVDCCEDRRIDLAATNPTCLGSNGTITASLTGTIAAGSVLTSEWKNLVTGVTVATNTTVATGLPAGSYSVSLTVTNGSLVCSYSATTSLSDAGSATVVVTSTTPTACATNTGTASLSITGTPSFTVTYAGAATGSLVSASGVVSLSGLAAGQYSVSVRDANGCVGTEDFVIEPAGAVGLDPVASATPASCTASNGSVTVTWTALAGVSTYSVTVGSQSTVVTGTSASFTGLSGGSYTVRVSIAGNAACGISDTTVVIPTTNGPALAVTTVQPLCAGADGVISVVSPVGGVTYGLYTVGGGLLVAGTSFTVTPGDYEVRARDVTGCESSTVVTIVLPSALAFNVTVENGECGTLGSLSVENRNPVDLTVKVYGAGGEVSLTNLAAGSYTVVASDANGCTLSEVVSITTGTGAPSLNIVKTDAGCGKANGEATVTASPSGTYTYLWSNGLTGSHVTGLLAGSYTVTVSDASGCTSSTVVSISDVEGPKLAGIVSTSATCLAANGGASVTATGGTGNLSYLWSTGATGTSLSSVVAGLYSVTVTDSKGCIDIAEVTIDRSAGSLTLAVGSLPSACSLNTGMVSVTALSGTAPYRYLWSNGSTSTGQTGLTSGVYSVTVTDANGCWVENSVNVNDVSGPSVVASFTAVQCSGGSTGIASVSVSGGSGILSYLWSTGATTSSVSNLAAGTYTVTVTDINGCQGSDEVTISEPAAIQAELSPSLIACGSTTGDISLVEIKGGTPGYTYLWSNGMTSSSLTTVAAGSYTVVITDGVGCTATGSATLSLPVDCCVAPALTLTGPTCDTATGTYSVEYSTSSATSVTVTASSGMVTPTMITGITIGTNVTVVASSACGAKTMETMFSPVTCPVTPACALVELSIGQAVCQDGTTYIASVTVTGGASITVLGGTYNNGVVTGTVGTNVTVLAGLAGCDTKGGVITSPVSCTTDCVNPLVSVSGPVCDGNNISYHLSVTLPAGVTLTASASATITTGVNPLVKIVTVPLGTNVTLTAGNGTCVDDIRAFVAPTDCPPCVAPALTLTGPTCDTATGTYSVEYTTSAGTSITASSGLVTPTMITGITIGTNVTVVASSACGARTMETMFSPVTCPVTPACALVELSIGQAVCQDGTTYIASVTVTGGASITVLGGTYNNGVVTGTVGTNVTVLAGLAGCDTKGGVITSPVSCTTDCVNPLVSVSGPVCDGNNISYHLSVTLPAGVTLTASASATITTGVNPLVKIVTVPLGTNVTLTAGNGTCVDDIRAFVAPTDCPPCVAPALTLTGPTCDTATGTYSVEYTTSAGTSITASSGLVTPTMITGITIGTNVTVVASSACGARTMETMFSPVTCPVTPACALVELSIGQAVCQDGTTYIASVTVTGGASITVLGGTYNNGVVTGTVGTNVTVLAGLAGCDTKGGVITSPVSCTTDCVNPLISVAGPVCDGNNISYHLSVTLPAGVILTASASATITTGVNPLVKIVTVPLGTNVTLTAGNGTCVDDVRAFVAPTDCPPCSLSATLAANNPTVCIGSPLSLSATVSPTGSYTYVWSGPNFSTTTTVPIVTIANATTANSGSYTVVVSNAAGCSYTAVTPVSVSVTPAPAAASNVALAICNNETIDLAKYFPAGGTFTELTSSSALIGSIFDGIVSQAGTFSVTYASASTGCGSSTAIVTIVVRSCSLPPCDFPISTAVVDATCGTSDGRAQALVGGLPSGATVGYNWSNGASGPQVSGLVAGVYAVTATVTNVPGASYLNGCTVVDTVNVNAIDGPEVDIAAIIPASCPNNNNGKVTLTIAAGASSAPFAILYTGPVSGSLSAGNVGNQTISNLPAGDYVFRVFSKADADSCSGYVGVHIPRDDAGRISVAASPTNAVACGSPTGSITYTVTLQPGVLAPFTYLLDGQIVGTSSLPTFTLNNVVAGAYVISVISADGCTSDAVPVVIEDTGAPQITGWTANDAKCPSDVASLVFAGGQPATTQYKVISVETGGTVEVVPGNQSRTLVVSIGSYAVIRTSTVDNCTSVDTLIINGPTGLSFNVRYKAATCGPNGSALADGKIWVIQQKGGLAPYTVRVLDNNNAVVNDASALTAGNYIVEVKDANGCFGIQQLLITIPDCQIVCPVLPLNTQVFDPRCGASDGTATASLGGLPAGSVVDYIWSNGQNGPNVLGLSAGVYSVTAIVTSTSGGGSVGCRYEKMINVNEVGGPIPWVRSIVPSRCSVNTGSVSLSISAGTAPYQVSWTGPNAMTGSQSAPNPSSVLIENLAPGSYTFVVTGTGSTCRGVMDVTIPVSTSADITLNATPTNISSCDASDGKLVITVNGGTPNYNFTVNGQSYPAQASTTLPINNLPAGYYSIAVTDSKGCMTNTSAVISTTGGPGVAGWTAESPLCPDNTGTLKFTGGQSASVSYRVLLGGSTLITTVPGNLSANVSVSRGVYVVERLDNDCISSYQSFTITSPEGLDFNVQGIGVTCGPGGTSNNDGIIRVVQTNGGTAPYTITIMDSQNQVVLNQNALAPGQYKVMVTDLNGCAGVKDVLVTVPPCQQVCPDLSFEKHMLDAECDRANGTATATLLGAPPFITYEWSNGQNGSSISGLASGVYSVTATITTQNGLYNGCQYVDVVHINNIGAPIASTLATSGASCTASNGSVVLNIAGGVTPYKVSWTGAASSSRSVANAGPVVISGLPAGDYIFTITGGTSTCQSFVEVTIPHNDTAVMQISATPTDVSGCGASDGSIKLNVTGGTPLFNYVVDGYITLSTSDRTPTFPNLPAGLHTVTVHDANGCLVEKSDVLINTTGNLPIAGWQKTDGLCASSTGTLVYTPTPGNASDQYVVRIAGSNTIVGQTPGNVGVTFNVAGGTYLVTRTSSNSCVAVDTLIVNQPEGLEINVQYHQPTCTSLTSGTIVVVQTTGGTPNYTTTVRNSSGMVNPTSLTAGSYTVTVTDAQGCTISEVVSLTIGDCQSCFNGYVYLQGSLIDDIGVWPTNPVTSTLVAGEPLMRDDLRAQGIIPLNDPYRMSPYNTSFTHVNNPYNESIVNPAVTLADRGENSVVDWVFLEFRSKTNPKIVQYTRSALVLRNGKIVDVDGVSCVGLNGLAADDYYVAVRHRNHLGVMTQTTRPFGPGAPDLTVDFRKLTPPQIWHDTSDPSSAAIYGDVERRDISWAPGYYALWGGNANRDDRTVFQGQLNDVDEVYNQVITSPGNFLNSNSYILPGYFSGDVNMNGVTIFQGQNNETDIIYNIMIQHPSNILNSNSFNIVEQLAR